MATKATIIEAKQRSVLAEGRNNGMGFAFLQKEGTEYKTVQPMSPCKDYLNEVIFTELTGIPTQGCGLHYDAKLNIFDKCGYLGIKIMPTSGGGYSYSNSIEKDTEMLAANYKHVEKLLNFFEHEIGTLTKTKITEANDGYFLVKTPVEWTKSTIAISLYSLLLRVGMAYDGEQEPWEFLEKYSYHSGDKNLLKPAIPKIKKIIELKSLPEQPQYDEAAAKRKSWSPHNYGIMHYQI